MKLLHSLPSVIDKEQLKNLQNFLFKQVDLNHIVWENVLDDMLKDFETLSFERVPYFLKYNYEDFSKQLDSVFISALVLTKEDGAIKDTLSKHEMIRKDEVKSFNDINIKAIDIITAADERFYQRNVEIKNNILALIPNKVQHYDPSSVSVEYFPGCLEYIVGNVPDNNNLLGGTFSGYWAADIYTNRQMSVGATVTFSYPSVIQFNNISFRGIVTYPLIIDSLEYYNLDTETWDALPYDQEYSKDFYITFGQTYNTNKIRITILQSHYDYIVKHSVDDAFIIRDIVITGRDINAVKNNRIEKIIKGEPVELVNRTTLANKFRYEVGAYNFQVFFKTYINVDGVFKSKEFISNMVTNDIKIVSDNNNIGDIRYKAVQEDESYVEYDSYIELDLTTNEPVNPSIGERYINTVTGSTSSTSQIVYINTLYEWTGTVWTSREYTDLPLNVKLPIVKTFHRTERFTDVLYNKVELERYPYIDAARTMDVVLQIDGVSSTRVTDFTQGNDPEFIVAGNNVYTSLDLAGSIVTVSYWYKSSTIVLEVDLNTNEDGFSFFTPEVNSLSLEINGVRQE